MNILVLGGTGNVGVGLVSKLLEAGHKVRCLVRDPKKISKKEAWDSVETIQGDVLKKETLQKAFNGIDVVYYLIHSMASGQKNFEEKDRMAAENVVASLSKTAVKRIIYLGGLGKENKETSAHLHSRHEVGNVLRSSGIPVTEFRAAVIIGAQSASFKTIYYLVKRLPVMICPRWVYVKTQPIAIADVLRYLAQALDIKESIGKKIDIGGPNIVTYGEMMLVVARALGLKRYLVPVPVLTPKLSSYWLWLTTPVPTSLTKPLILGLRNETTCEDNKAEKLFSFHPMPLKEAVELALQEDEHFDEEGLS